MAKQLVSTGHLSYTAHSVKCYLRIYKMEPATHEHKEGHEKLTRVICTMEQVLLQERRRQIETRVPKIKDLKILIRNLLLCHSQCFYVFFSGVRKALLAENFYSMFHRKIIKLCQ